MGWAILGFLLGLHAVYPALSQEPALTPPIVEELRHFRELGSVLHIAAHPDDENTQLITYLARGRGYRAAYLSLTRGDGGQNVLGPEFREQLGVARTQELLAARRLDGGQQFFTRANDFGFSKDYRETLQIWDKQEVLSDIVRVIRTFRPDVLVTRFSPQPGGTHGHHTASAVLALEAFKLAGDPKAFPEQLGQLKPWQPKRIFQNGGGGKGLQVDVGGNDPVLGEPFSSIAGKSRAMHKTQGFGNFSGGGRGGPRMESFILLDGEPAEKDILDGVDTTWGRFSGGAEIGRLTTEAIDHFNTQNPGASVPALLAIRSRVDALAPDPVVAEKRHQLDGIIQACLGLQVKTTVAKAEKVPGEAMDLQLSTSLQDGMPVRWLGARFPSLGKDSPQSVLLTTNEPLHRNITEVLPTNTPPSQPYWLQEEGTVGMFRVKDLSLIGRPENPPVFPVQYIFEVGGQKLVVDDEPVQLATDSAKPRRPQRLEVIPPVSLHFASEVELFGREKAKTVSIDVTAARPHTTGVLELVAPTGWAVTPKSSPLNLAATGDHVRVSFVVTAPANPSTASFSAVAEVNGMRCDNQRIEIRYDHLPTQLLQPPARLKAICLDLETRGKRIGYLPGAGDDVAGCLEHMGYTVTRLTGEDLIPEKLGPLDAVVVGIRAFNVREDLGSRTTNLFAYAENGGTVIVQYNRPDGLKSTKLAPFDLRLSQERVTDENAAVTFLAPDHTVLNVPNKISPADFEGWVQERGVYFPNEWDKRFVPILACNDAGEAPKNGGLLVAPVGRGYFVYTGLAWFRQLPAGVPGAYRLFANLVSLGK